MLSFAKKVLMTAFLMCLFFAKGSVGEAKCLFGANILVIKTSKHLASSGLND